MTSITDLHCDTVGRLIAGADIHGARDVRGSSGTWATGTAESANDAPAKAGPATPAGHVDLPRLKAGGVGLQAFAAYVAPEEPFGAAYRKTSASLDVIVAMCEANGGDMALVTDVASAEAAASSGRVGVLLTVENGHAIENDLANLDTLRRRGVRIMTLVHVRNTDWVASCAEERAPFDGLSAFGEKVVDAMCDMGMIPDVSHAAEAAFWKVAARTRSAGKPLIASHSNAWELCRVPRNLKDDQIREIADQGGLIGINFFPYFLDERYQRASGAAAARAAGITSEAIIRHIDHIVNVAGDEVVAFGSDFDGIPATPEDVTGSDAYPAIISQLRARGYTDVSLERIANGNFRRVLAAYD